MKTSTVPYSCQPEDLGVLNMRNTFVDLRIRYVYLFASSVCIHTKMGQIQTLIKNLITFLRIPFKHYLSFGDKTVLVIACCTLKI